MRLSKGLWICISVVAFLGCKSPSSTATSEGNQKDDFNGILPVSASIYHNSDSTTQVFLTIKKKSLLYARKQGSGPFEAEVELKWQLFKLNELNLTHLDSSTVSFSHALNEKSEKFVQFNTSLNAPPGNYFLKLIITDKRRKSGKSISLKIDKTDRENALNFKITRHSDGLVMNSELLNEGDSVRIESSRNKDKTVLHLYTLTQEIKLPPAPFSGSFPEFPSIKDAEHNSIIISDGGFNLKVARSLYLVSAELLPKKGMSFYGRELGFPEVKHKNQLHPPLRYLTTKLEFESMMKAKNPKEKVDRFWVDCGGSKDRARVLIQEYYTRVEISNAEFSTYTEGWRTDRGMIYLVFGDPSKILRTPTQETWIYGDEDNPASLRFQFKKLDNPWSDNIFVLSRDPLYKTHWERMVTSWRSGRIYTN